MLTLVALALLAVGCFTRSVPVEDEALDGVCLAFGLLALGSFADEFVEKLGRDAGEKSA